MSNKKRPNVTRCGLCGNLVAQVGRRALELDTLDPHTCQGPLPDLPGHPPGAWERLASTVSPAVKRISEEARRGLPH